MRRFESSSCPKCQREWIKRNLIGNRLIKIVYSGKTEQVEAWGVKVKCSCNIDLFIWLEYKNGDLTSFVSEFHHGISYYHTFNTVCNPAERLRKVDPRPEGLYFEPKGADHKRIRGLLAHRTVKYKRFQESKLRWYDNQSGPKPVWAVDDHDCQFYWSASSDEYYKEVNCDDMDGCDSCIQQGRPYDFEEASEQDRIVYYLGETKQKYKNSDLVYYLGLNGKWHPSRIVEVSWNSEDQVWLYSIVDLGETYNGEVLQRPEGDLYGTKPDWEPVIMDQPENTCPSP